MVAPFGDGVVAAILAGPASEQTASREPAASRGAVDVDRLVGVLGAGRLKTATPPEGRRYRTLVEANEEQERCSQVRLPVLGRKQPTTPRTTLERAVELVEGR
jgi:hypothetical protein